MSTLAPNRGGVTGLGGAKGNSHSPHRKWGKSLNGPQVTMHSRFANSRETTLPFAARIVLCMDAREFGEIV
jgi:hypothetical protein